MELLLKKEEKKEEIQTTEVTDICSDIYFSTLIKKKKQHKHSSTIESPPQKLSQIYIIPLILFTLFFFEDRTLNVNAHKYHAIKTFL